LYKEIKRVKSIKKLKPKLSDNDGERESGNENVNEEKGLQIDRKASKNQNCLTLWPGHTGPPKELPDLG